MKTQSDARVICGERLGLPLRGPAARLHGSHRESAEPFARFPLLSRNTPREYSYLPAKVIFNLWETCHVDSFDSDRVSHRVHVCGISTGQFNRGAADPVPHVESKYSAAELDKVDNTPPAGFVALFNGKDLTGWKGLLKQPLDNPARRANLSPEARKTAQEEANKNMAAHWKVENGIIIYDGNKGRSLCTTKDYGDFERCGSIGRSKPAATAEFICAARRRCRSGTRRTNLRSGVNSGGLYNNQKGPHDPTAAADRPVGVVGIVFRSS